MHAQRRIGEMMRVQKETAGLAPGGPVARAVVVGGGGEVTFVANSRVTPRALIPARPKRSSAIIVGLVIAVSLRKMSAFLMEALVAELLTPRICVARVDAGL